MALISLGSAGFLAGRAIQTGQRSDLNSENPIVTAPVRRGALRDIVVGSAEFKPLSTIAVMPPELPSGFRPVVTERFVNSGERVQAGHVLLAIAARPIFVLKGALPVYRPLHRGLIGEDVLQLQRAMEPIGISIRGDEPGVYGIGTAQAVSELYRRNGFTPVGSSGTELRSGQPRASIPLGEVIFVNHFPATVGPLDASRGEIVGQEPITTIIGGAVRIIGTVAASDIPRIEKGHRGTVDLGPGKPLTIRVSSTPPRQGRRSRIRVDLSTPAPVSRSLLGASRPLTIVVDRTRPDAFIVPAMAIHENAAGQTWIEVANGESVTEVSVTILLVSGGEAAIESHDDSLTAGDEVVVGVGDGTT